MVLPLDHPLAQQESIPLAALQNDSFIVLPPHEASLGCICTICACSRDFAGRRLSGQRTANPAGAGGGGLRHYAAAGQLRPHPVARRPLLLAAAGAAGGSVRGLPRRQRHAGRRGLWRCCGRRKRPAAQITSSAAPSAGRRCRDRPSPASGCNTGTGSVRR